MTRPKALAALRNAVASGNVRIAGHALERAEQRGWDVDDILNELEVAARWGEVGASDNSPGRWLAYGVYMVICFEVIAPNIVVITVFHQEGHS